MNKKTLSIAAAILTIAGSTAAFAAELPTYEANGFPVSPCRCACSVPRMSSSRQPCRPRSLRSTRPAC